MYNHVKSIASPTHLAMVDWLKGIAIIMVILVHYAQSFTLMPWLQKTFQFFQMGCQIFFVVSAFTICISYTSKKPPYFQFLKHRFSVLAKGWYLAILLHIIVNSLMQIIFSNSTLYNSTFWDIFINLLFLNGFVPGPANNLVVRGGWFVGTISIFYLIFPLIYKIYMFKNTWWRKYRYIVFPIASFAASFIILNLANVISGKFECTNNSFIYFSIVCQWPCLSVGFSLFDILSNKDRKKIKLVFPKFLLFLFLTVIFFYSGINQIFTVIPFMSAVCVFYLFLYLYQVYPDKAYNKLLVKFGEINFGVYLTQSFVAWEFADLCKSLILQSVPNISETVIFLLLLPIVLMLSYWIGKIFLKVSNMIPQIINRIFRICERK